MFPKRYEDGFPYNLHTDGIPFISKHPVYGLTVVKWVTLKRVSSELVNTMIHACTDETVEIRMTAAFILGAVRDERATEMLLDLTNDENDDVRAVAIWALGNIPSTVVLDRLIDIVDEESYPPALTFAIYSRNHIEIYLAMCETTEETSG